MRSRYLTLFCGLTLSACAMSAPHSEPMPELIDDRELIVLVEPPVAPLISAAERMAYVVTATYPLDDLDDTLVVFRIPEGTSIPEAIDEVETAVPGTTAGAHHVYHLQADLGRSDSPHYANGMLGWPDEGCPALRPVGLLDSGLAETEPAVVEGLVINRRFVESEQPPATDHGTLMASLLVGEGRLTGATLFSADVVDPEREAGDSAGVVAILRGLNWLKSSGVEIVNVSLAGPRNKLMARAFGTAAGDGMVFVAAAGNQGPDAPPQFPAAFPGALAVTAIDRDGNVYDRAIRGDHIDFAAPGVDILIEAGGRMRIFSGTSAAAPFVAASIAADPSMIGLSADQIRVLAKQRVIDLGEAGKDPIFGEGLLGAPGACLRL